MATPIKMPKLGMSMSKGTLTRWLKQDGEPVRAGEALVEVETDKINYTVESPGAGLVRRVGAEGAEFPVGGVLGYVAAEGEALPTAAPETVAASVAAAAPSRAPAPAAPARAGGAPGRSSPIARRLAQEHDIDLMQVQGTGPGGRIVEADIQALIDARTGPAPSPMRRVLATRMAESAHTTAPVTLFTEVCVSELVALRGRLQEQFPVTYTDFILRAVAKALEQHPRLNATFAEGRPAPQREIHLGVAVALDEGLIVPVIHDANRKSLRQIAEAARDLAARARRNALQVDEVTGATFTVTNLGAYGVDGFTPIINLPEVAILGVGRIVKKPAVREEAVAVLPMLTLSLTFDHRAVDGAPAAAFLRDVAELLQTPDWQKQEAQ